MTAPIFVSGEISFQSLFKLFFFCILHFLQLITSTLSSVRSSSRQLKRRPSQVHTHGRLSNGAATGNDKATLLPWQRGEREKKIVAQLHVTNEQRSALSSPRWPQEIHQDVERRKAPTCSIRARRSRSWPPLALLVSRPRREDSDRTADRCAWRVASDGFSPPRAFFCFCSLSRFRCI